MSNLDFFKKQAKNLLKDWQTQTKTEDNDGYISYHYDWKFYNIGSLFLYYEFDNKDEEEIILARAQHLIAKMAGFKKWGELIHASEAELELAEFLLRRFKNSQDVQGWEEAIYFARLFNEPPEIKLAYARQYYELGEKEQLAQLPIDKISVLSGKQKLKEINNFDDEHNPAGMLRKDSTVFCTHCKKTFIFKQSKVIKDNDGNLTMVVCKNYPNCKGTYLDYKVLSPTIMYKDTRTAELKRGLQAFPDFSMSTKVHCLNCGKEFLYSDTNVVMFPDDDEPLIMCKHYPECDGSLIDMMATK